MTDSYPVELTGPGAVIAPGGWEPFATFADTHSSRLHLTVDARVRVYTSSLVDAPDIPCATCEEVRDGEIGWLEQADGRVDLGAGLHEGSMDPQVARMLDVIEAPVSLWRGGLLRIEGLSEPVAEQVVRVLAPLGLIFDANSPLLPEF